MLTAHWQGFHFKFSVSDSDTWESKSYVADIKLGETGLTAVTEGEPLCISFIVADRLIQC